MESAKRLISGWGRLGLFLFLVTAALGGAWVLASCASSDDDETAESNKVENTGAAVGAVFGSSDEAGLRLEIPERIASLMVRRAWAKEGPSTCDDAVQSGGPGNGVQVSASGTPGVYGNSSASGESIEVVEGDFCETGDGTANVEPASDGGGLFATYLLTEDVSGTCSDGSAITMNGSELSAGIWRLTEDCDPEIFGNFELGSGTVVSCHLCFGEDSSVDSSNSSCSTAGSPVSLASEVTCEIDAGEEPGESCEIASCSENFDCQQVAETAITDGNPICDGNEVSCMTCEEDCCQLIDTEEEEEGGDDDDDGPDTSSLACATQTFGEQGVSASAECLQILADAGIDMTGKTAYCADASEAQDGSSLFCVHSCTTDADCTALNQLLGDAALVCADRGGISVCGGGE